MMSFSPLKKSILRQAALFGGVTCLALAMTSCSSTGGKSKTAGGVAGEQALVEEAPAEQMTLVDYEVQKGDTLWDLAGEYNTSVSEIKAINSLESDIIMYGKTIKLPVKKVLEQGEQPYLGMDASTNQPVSAQPKPVVPTPIIPEY